MTIWFCENVNCLLFTDSENDLLTVNFICTLIFVNACCIPFCLMLLNAPDLFPHDTNKYMLHTFMFKGCDSNF